MIPVLVASKEELYTLPCEFRDRLPTCLPILGVKIAFKKFLLKKVA